MEYNGEKHNLNGESPLNLILCGNIQNSENGKVGVVSVVFATADKALAEKRLKELAKNHPNDYYMVYDVPLDTDLTTLMHYPSVAITKEDLQ